MKIVSYRQAGRHGVGVVTGAKGLIALSKVAPDLPDDLRKILEIDPTLAKVRAATAGQSADLSTAQAIHGAGTRTLAATRPAHT